MDPDILRQHAMLCFQSHRVLNGLLDVVVDAVVDLLQFEELLGVDTVDGHSERDAVRVPQPSLGLLYQRFGLPLQAGLLLGGERSRCLLRAAELRLEAPDRSRWARGAQSPLEAREFLLFWSVSLEDHHSNHPAGALAAAQSLDFGGRPLPPHTILLRTLLLHRLLLLPLRAKEALVCKLQLLQPTPTRQGQCCSCIAAATTTCINGRHCCGELSLTALLRRQPGPRRGPACSASANNPRWK
mmetsp:Transcript_59280/g.150083  ORF Transcript_59280/g.150083 Transcript_59280/m.150083 type:complete len:242 (-) Transcript_59280:437-1162(-)